jgi:CRISPR/Cas system-associated exonuclease Cas4 (RecB family)
VVAHLHGSSRPVHPATRDAEFPRELEGLRLQVVTKTKVPVVQVADVERGPRDEDDFLRTAVGVLRAVDAGVVYPVRGWACKGCQFAHACKPKRPRLALVA